MDVHFLERKYGLTDSEPKKANWFSSLKCYIYFKSHFCSEMVYLVIIHQWFTGKMYSKLVQIK